MALTSRQAAPGSGSGPGGYGFSAVMWSPPEFHSALQLSRGWRGARSTGCVITTGMVAAKGLCPWDFRAGQVPLMV